MAEQFIIRVQVDGQGQGRTSTGTSGLGLAAGAALLANTRDERLEKVERGLNKTLGKWQPPDGVSEVIGVENFKRIKRGLFRDTYQAQAFGFTPEPEGQMTFMGPQKFNIDITGRVPTAFSAAIVENQTKIAAGAVGLTFKSAQTAISIKQHRSGDSYYNQQLNNSMKFARYGAIIGASFKLGPKGPILAAASIAISESFNLYTENANFKFDRKMDTAYIHNVRQVSGDVSYGRRRRGGD